jgi:RNA polymerase sigma factor (sigma-70 family)
MALSPMSKVLEHLRDTVLSRQGAELTDGQLLECFVHRREGAALEALVLRHAPMVWNVCRRLLRHDPDVEDAFQATFLVLVRKAASIVPAEMVGSWLHGVAHHTALKARATMAKRRQREKQLAVMPEREGPPQDVWTDLQPVLDHEVSRLSDKYRAAIVLCDLEGKSRKEAARQLGVAEGTVASRLTRARAMLAKRLTQRGVVLSVGTLAALLSEKAAAAGVPSLVASSLRHGVTLAAAGSPGAAGAISPTALAFSEGVVKAMLLKKLRTVMMVLVVLGLGAAALVGGVIITAQAKDEAPGPGHQAVRSEEKPQALLTVEALAAGIERRQAMYRNKRYEYSVKAKLTPSPEAKVNQRGADAFESKDVLKLLDAKGKKPAAAWKSWERHIKNKQGEWNVDWFASFDGEKTSFFSSREMQQNGWKWGLVVPFEDWPKYQHNMFELFLDTVTRKGDPKRATVHEFLSDYHFKVTGKRTVDKRSLYVLEGAYPPSGITFEILMTGEPEFMVMRWVTEATDVKNRPFELLTVKELKTIDGVVYPGAGEYHRQAVGELEEHVYQFSLISVEPLNEESRKSWAPAWPAGTAVNDQVNNKVITVEK